MEEFSKCAYTEHTGEKHQTMLGGFQGRPCLQPIFQVSTQEAVIRDAYVPGSLLWEHIVLDLSLLFPHAKTQVEWSNFIFLPCHLQMNLCLCQEQSD